MADFAADKHAIRSPQGGAAYRIFPGSYSRWLKKRSNTSDFLGSTVETIVDDDMEARGSGCVITASGTPSELIGPYGVHKLDAICLAVVFEDLADQLDIMGKKVDAPAIELRSKASVIHDERYRRPRTLSCKENLSRPEEDRWLLRQNYESIIPRRISQMCGYDKALWSLGNTNATIEKVTLAAKTDAGKCQADRSFLQDIANKVVTELVQKSSFRPLFEIIENEKLKKADMYYRYQKAIQDRVDIKSLKEEISKTKQSKLNESARLQQMIWDLEDAMQEVRARCAMEREYIFQTASMMKKRIRKQCSKNERDELNTLKELRLTFSLEQQANFSMKSIIETKTQKAENLLEYWLDKYDIDKEFLTNQLDQMKEDRKRDLARKEWLEYMTTQYMPIVKDERRVKRIMNNRQKKAEDESKKAIRIQAWWRGTMVREALGPFKAIHQKPEPVKEVKKGKEGKKKR